MEEEEEEKVDGGKDVMGRGREEDRQDWWRKLCKGEGMGGNEETSSARVGGLGVGRKPR